MSRDAAAQPPAATADVLTAATCAHDRWLCATHNVSPASSAKRHRALGAGISFVRSERLDGEARPTTPPRLSPTRTRAAAQVAAGACRGITRPSRLGGGEATRPSSARRAPDPELVKRYEAPRRPRYGRRTETRRRVNCVSAFNYWRGATRRACAAYVATVRRRSATRRRGAALCVPPPARDLGLGPGFVSRRRRPVLHRRGASSGAVAAATPLSSMVRWYARTAPGPAAARRAS